MKSLNTIVKILTALVTVAGAVYIVATYGEQIVAWAKQLLEKFPKCPCCEEAEFVEEFEAEPAESAEEAPAEEPAAEEVPVEEPIVEDPAPEVVVAEHEPVAEEADFAE